LVLENPDPCLDEHLAALGITATRIPDAPSEDELVRLLREGRYHLIYKRSRVPITERVVKASPDLAAVMLCCIGDDSVDKEACASQGVLVTNDPVSNGRSVAEMVIGELVMLSRRLYDSVSQMASSVWRKDNQARYELYGKRLGIVGLGNIGRQVAQLGQAMGMEILFHDSAEVPREVGLAMGWERCDTMQALFKASDFVTIHVSAEDHRGRSNQNLVTYDLLKQLGDKEGESPRIFLNLARGFVVPPEDLRRAVTEGHVSYAITDVFPSEPGAMGSASWTNPYEGEPRIFATPHIGAATREAQPRIARYVARTTQLLSQYGMIRNCIYRPRAEIDFAVDYATAMLAVVHVDKRGTKKAVDDAIFAAGANNLRSAHIDFPNVGIAYDVSALDQALSPEATAELAREAIRLTGDPTAIRWMRTIPLDPTD
jgi:D-3-phosphoglycerate dehydrogenase